MSCPADSPAHCTGPLSLRTAGSVHLGGLKVVLELGSARYGLAPGASTTLKVKLARVVERVANRKGHIKAVAIASTGSSGKIASTTQRLTLALGTARKKGR